MESKGISYYDRFEGTDKRIWEVLLEPTRIYSREINNLKKTGVIIKGMAHITGGGIPGNLIRVLPDNCKAIVEANRIPSNPIFDWIRDLGKVPMGEMYKTFNMGVGFMVVVSKEDVEKVLKAVESSFVCGHIEEGKKDVLIV